MCKEGKVCIPMASASLFIAQYHGIGHRGWKATCELLGKDFYISDLPLLTRDYLSRCITCIRNNPNNPNKAKHEHLIYPSTPFTHLQVDFTHMPKLGKRQEYFLVVLDMFSRWVEIFVTTKEDAQTVVKILTGNYSSMGMSTSDKLRQRSCIHLKSMSGLGTLTPNRMEVSHSISSPKFRDSEKGK